MALDQQQQSNQSTSSNIPQGNQQRAERIFETEELILKAKMLEVDLEKTIYLIENESLSRRAKMALFALIFSAFDKNVVLANNPDIDLRVLRFEEQLNKTRLSFSRPDAMNPSIVYIVENIRQSFRDFVSRSYNMTERRLQGERKSVQISSFEQPTPEQAQAGQPNQRRNGLDRIMGLFGGGK
jgi:hypothetical protein